MLPVSSEPQDSGNELRLDVPDAAVVYFPTFFPPARAERLRRELSETTEWRQDKIQLYGQLRDIPRNTAWYGDDGATYTYSRITHVPLPWTLPLLEVKEAVESVAGVAFNGVLLNRYRDGRDSVSWHSDDEAEFGENPVIASVSFGATRTFHLKHKTRGIRTSLELTHGSLLLMRGETQHHWLHQIPKTKTDVGERINLTFRLIRQLER